MKNIVLLGNGFDLYHQLPTKYANFLHVVDFLQKNRSMTFETIGDVFSQASLQEIDPFIKNCYETHTNVYDNVLLDKDAIVQIVKLTEKNMWVLYLQTVFNKDVGWIDFEKEISVVLKCFEKAFKKRTNFVFHSDEQYERYILPQFDFFITKAPAGRVVTPGLYEVNKDYCTETPIGSKNYIINTAKVVDKLYEELVNLSKALELYLKCFIESTCEVLKTGGGYKTIDIFSYMEKAITFNYTNTYEKFYPNKSAFHIHGSINNEIVLGVNPDASDNLESLDTTFLCFKKYFQRTLFETETEYLRWMTEVILAKMPYRLFTMGHSLDVTDKDIIAELFQNATEIIVMYHDLDAKKSYISNLVAIFGKEGFDILKKEKKLTFVSLEQDLTWLRKIFMEEEAMEELHAMCWGEEGEEIVIV